MVTAPTERLGSILVFLPPSEIERWLDSPPQQWAARLEIGSMSLLEHLTNDVEKPSHPAFEVARPQAERFFSRLETELKDPASPIQGKLASAFGILSCFLAEAGPYRFESRLTDPAVAALLKKYRALRLHAQQVMHSLFQNHAFDPLRQAVDLEIGPLLRSISEAIDGRDDRYMPFRVLVVGAIAELLRFLALRVDAATDPDLRRLLDEMYRLKYLRFGTSGYRGVWNRDFTEEKTRIITQAICDFLKLQNMPKYAKGIGEDLSGRVVVIGYDGRRNSTFVANLVAEICLANGFTVYYSSRPTPTPALNFFAREVIGRDRVAGLINCTASHNPPEWQGIKFNPKEGYPAPTNLTDIIAARATVRQLLQTPLPRADLALAESSGTLQQFDPLELYLDYCRQSGHGNRRLAINLDNIKAYFGDKCVILDPMYGAGRGYLSKILGELGIPHTVIHDERDEDLGKQVEKVRGIPHLEYANPEPDFIQPLIDKVIEQDAALGMGVDTDADRYGFVDKKGVYIRPNQILAMLTRYLGVDRGEAGRVIITQTGLPMIDAIAGKIPNNSAYRPPKGTLPAYIAAPFYHERVGDAREIAPTNVYVVPVGIKYIVDVARVADGVTNPADAYRAEPDSAMPPNWMDRMLIGGEESSGLTTRGHVPDKDGPWANLLVMDMIAHYGLRAKNKETSLAEIWEATISMDVTWKTYGDRVDVDTTAQAKETLLNYFLDLYKDWKSGDPLPQLVGLDIYYLGGTRYDFVEIFLKNDADGKRFFLRVRASGTEPITRVYVESASQALAEQLINVVLERLDQINVELIRQAYSIENLADLLSNTRFAPLILELTGQLLKEKHWDRGVLSTLLNQRRPHVESRNARLMDQWVEKLA